MTPPTLNDISTVLTGTTTGGRSGRLAVSRHRARMLLMLTDTLAILGTMAVVIAVRAWLAAVPINIQQWLPAATVIVGTVLAVTAWRGLYPGYGRCAVVELRTVVYAVTAAYAAAIAMSYFTHGVLPYSRSILLIAWPLTIPVLAGTRTLVRWAMADRPWYGIPVIIVGEQDLSRRIVDTLASNRRIGLRPFVIVEPDTESADYGYYATVPIIAGTECVPRLVDWYGLRHGIIALPHASQDDVERLLEHACDGLSNVTFVGEHVPPSVFWISNVQADPVRSAEIEQRLVEPALRFKKRLFDIVVTLAMLVVAAPLMLLIMIAIRLTSPGPFFFLQDRIGEGGRLFKLVKFRTMQVDAERRLQAMIASDPVARDEWERMHKLRNDPRIIAPVGHWLRRLSLDELPQLWNILRGDMSLVGPRPRMIGEMDPLDMRRTFVRLYTKTKPGLTGMWQVTVRNDADYDVRSHIDLYYMRNWSIFLDLYIIVRTAGVVFLGRGA